MATDLNTLMSRMRSRGTVISKHDLLVLLDEAVLRAGESGGLEYGQLQLVNDGGCSIGSFGTTPVLFFPYSDAFDGNAPGFPTNKSLGTAVTADGANDRLVVNTTGSYRFIFSSDGEVGGANDQIILRLRRNGTVFNNIQVIQRPTSITDQISAHINLIIPDLTAGDIMTIEISGNDGTNNQTLLVFDTTFRLELIAAA